MKQTRVETKHRWAARLARRRARGMRPAPKPKRSRAKREPRRLEAGPNLAVALIDRIFGPYGEPEIRRRFV